ncbi:SGNH/GDSL hydrolase family protein [Citrobacter portucalensis]|uniref:SGNH/GDSL hydrolase family protein n=1 Tax=Citrobacter portucalensis TaxID=1639133 RepID=A0A9X4JPQ3_9ENTR|nr:SGNH/GDSL hydrolase family protein [Citrobacter portucalensis]MDE9621362.1 SGNH/GDSL hydrolase family protein [Citrobacter portucalensis]
MERRTILKAILLASASTSMPAVHAAVRSSKSKAVPDSFGLNNLKSTHIKTMGISSGDKTIFNVVFIGDSWTHVSNRYSGVLADYLTEKYGDAGSGWIGLGSFYSPRYFTINGCARAKKFTVKYDNPESWAIGGYANRNTPDISVAGSNKVGAKITVFGSGPVIKYKICYQKSNGIFKYKVSGSEWVTIDASKSSTDISFHEREGKFDGAWNIEFVVVSGECLIGGIMTYTGNSGVIVNKLGSTGSTTRDWAGKDRGSWVFGMEEMSPDLVTILLGTNDQNIPLTVDEYSRNVLKIISRVREVNDDCDILLIAPCENARKGNKIPMRKYANALYEIAKLKKIGFLNLQPVFGETPSHYDMDSRLPLIGPDKIHPIESTGGRLIAYSIKEALGV